MPLDRITGNILNTFSIRNGRSGGRWFPAGITHIDNGYLVTSWTDDIHHAIQWDGNHIDEMRSIMGRYVTAHVHFMLETDENRFNRRIQHGLI